MKGAKVEPHHRKYFPKPDINIDIDYAKLYYDVIEPRRYESEQIKKILYERSKNNNPNSFLSSVYHLSILTINICFNVVKLFVLVCVIVGIISKLLAPLEELIV